MSYQAEYIWIDGTKPSPLCYGARRESSRTGKDPGIWGFDGSSTNQAPGHNSDCVLQPVFVCPDPIRGGDNVLVLCDVELPDGSAHETNTSASCLQGRRRQICRPGADVRYRAGVHLLQERGAPGLARTGLPRSPGPLLLRSRRSQDGRPRDHRGAHPRKHQRGPLHRGDQRRGHDGPVGVPDRRPPATADRRRDLDGPVAPLPDR